MGFLSSFFPAKGVFLVRSCVFWKNSTGPLKEAGQFKCVLYILVFISHNSLVFVTMKTMGCVFACTDCSYAVCMLVETAYMPLIKEIGCLCVVKY